MKNLFFNFWALLLKIYIFEVVTFFSPSGYPVNSIFQWQYVFNKIHVFDETFCLWTIRMRVVTKLFKMVTCYEELSHIHMHDISMEWSFEDTWQIKYIYPPAKNVVTQEQHNLVQQKIKNETTNFVRNQLHKNTKKPKGNVEMCKKYFLRKLCREIVLSHEYNFQFF